MRKVVVIHVHYLETLESLLGYAKAVSPDLMLITYTKKIESIDQIKNDFSEVKFFHLENRGRDIYPLIFLSKLGYFEQDSLVWKLHSKKSLHLLRGKNWFKELCESIAKDSNRVSDICEFFSNTNVSMVGSKKYLKYISPKVIREHSKLFCEWDKTLGFSFPSTHAQYISGTMFVVRSIVFDQLKYLKLEREDFYLEDLKRMYTKWFALKLFIFNKLKMFVRFAELLNELDKRTRPASQATYALESYLGAIASRFGETKAI